MLQFRRYYSNQPSLFDFISKLRGQTAMSINLCRKAALESKLDYKLALEILSQASDKSFNPNIIANNTNFGKEGLIGIMGSFSRKCLIELRCDSDFVAQNPEFISVADSIMSSILNSCSENISDLLLPEPFNKTIGEILNLNRSKFRENIGIESIKLVTKDIAKAQVFGHYLHQKLGRNSGKIGSLVKIEVGNEDHLSDMEDVANSLARQVVALSDAEITISKLLNSEYLFAPVGSVRNFIESLESKYSSKITVLDMLYAKIK